MKPESRMIAAVAVSAAILLVWQTYIVPPPPAPTATATAMTTSAPATTPSASPAAAIATVADPQADAPVEMITLANELSQVTITTAGGVPISWVLPQYPGSHAADAEPLDAITLDAQPLRIVAPGLAGVLPDSPHFTILQQTPTMVDLEWQSSTLRVRKQYTFEADYALRVTVAVENRGAAPLQSRLGLAWEATYAEPPPRAWWSFLQQPDDHWAPVVLHDGAVTHFTNPTTLHTAQHAAGNIPWTATATRYFAAAVVPVEQSTQMEWTAVERVAPTPHHWLHRLTVAGAPLVFVPGTTQTQQFIVFVGPKKPALLRPIGHDLERLVDYGWFGFVARPMLTLLNFFYGLAHNYGVAIILLTVFVKLLLHPINKSSMASMKKMQQVQPRLAALREKFKGDPTRLNAEMMQLFRAEKINPAGGCLPMLLQLPIYFALYKVLWNSVELYRAPFFGFYRDLSAPDPYFISPILMGVAFWLQQKLTPNPSADPAQAKMMQIMSLVFTAFMLFLPSGLVLYILINTAVSVFQQWLMNRGLRMRDVLRGQFTAKAA